MKIFKKPILVALLILVSNFSAEVRSEEFRFVSIEGLVEQRIAEILIAEIYAKIGHTVTILPLPARRAEEMLKANKIDGEILRIKDYGALHRGYILRVPTSFYYIETMAFASKGLKANIRNRQDLEPYRLVKILGIKHTNNISENMPMVTDTKTTLSMMQMLQNGRADIGLTSNIDGQETLNRMNIDDIVPVSPALAKLELFHYLSSQRYELLHQVDSTIKAMHRTGELEKLIEKTEKTVIHSR
ncbi:MAG: transporter substrate-binding domain-containing protein [Alphaproteobacteria bacterium]|nr:transporter substrate-binding domain-containing protein [Alphaproteobacteria bacterium]